MFVFKAAVVGAGAMGAEIAHTIASAGIPVVLKDVDRARVESGIDHARMLWQRRVDAGKMDSAALDHSLALISGTTDYAALRGVDFAIEDTLDQIEAKRAVFTELDETTPGHAILASNTSTLSITELGEATSRPEKVVGFHFFHPASAVRLVEVIEGEDTSHETVQVASNFAQAIRKTSIRSQDSPGFVVNRIVFASASEVWRHQEESGTAIEELDRIVSEAKAVPVGPFFLADQLGLDTVTSLTERLKECYGDRFHVHQGMRDRVAAGDLGAKTGKGFYDHGN